MDLSAIALQGLQQADARLQVAAAKVVSFGASSPNAANLDIVDLSAAMVALMSAKTEFSANLDALKTASEVQKNLIDVMA